MRIPTILAALALLAAQLGSGAGAAAAQTASDPRTLVVGNSFDVKTLDPARGYENTEQMVNKVAYDTLITLDDNDLTRIVPDLATSWDVSPDAKTFTYHLRQGVTFQNSGNPMTSADVKWSWERAQGI